MYKTLKFETLKLWIFCFFNLPMIFWLRPRILVVNPSEAVVMIKLNRRSRNHVHSMYFGVLCTGADLVPGVLAMHIINKQKEKVTFVFKDFKADFLHRCESDVIFKCQDGPIIASAIEQAIKTSERQNVTVNVVAIVPDKLGEEPAAKFSLTISLKKK